jgi:20S proteasome alpha/beta subunit
VEPKYDRSITTFSSDGRLQQVEYGMEASRRGDSVVAMKCDDFICVAVHSSDKVHRIDDHAIMVTAGLAGDGRMLASTIRSQCQRFRQATGEAPSIREVSQMAASLQHQLTRTPGARPFGCTAIIAGVDDGDSLGLFQTDSGGILEECIYCAAGKGQEMAMASLESLSTDLQEGVKRLELVRGIAKVALKDKENEGPPHVNVWIIRGDKKRRGRIHLRCIQSVTCKALPRFDESLLHRMNSGQAKHDESKEQDAE